MTSRGMHTFHNVAIGYNESYNNRFTEREDGKCGEHMATEWLITNATIFSKQQGKRDELKLG